MSDEVVFDATKLAKFKRAYKYAVDEGFDKFTFEGKDYLTKYAAYLIAFLETKIHKH